MESIPLSRGVRMRDAAAKKGKDEKRLQVTDGPLVVGKSRDSLIGYHYNVFPSLAHHFFTSIYSLQPSLE